MTDRTPKDYAIEFGEYLAQAAERYVAMIEDYAVLGGEDSAADEIGAAYQALESAIYEFRKRARKS